MIWDKFGYHRALSRSERTRCRVKEGQLFANVDVEALTDGDDHLHGGQRVTAEPEEVIVETDRRDREQVLPHRHHDVLVCGGRRHVTAGP